MLNTATDPVKALIANCAFTACAETLGLTLEEVKADTEIASFINKWVFEEADYFKSDYSVSSLYGFAYHEIASVVSKRRGHLLD